MNKRELFEGSLYKLSLFFILKHVLGFMPQIRELTSETSMVCLFQ